MVLRPHASRPWELRARSATPPADRGHWPHPARGTRIALTMRRAYWHHCGQLLACAAVAFLLAAHEKLCTLPARPVQPHARQDAPASGPPDPKPRRKPPALTERTPDCVSPRRIVREPLPLRSREWTQRQSDAGADRAGSSGEVSPSFWRLLALVRSSERPMPPAVASRPEARRLRMLFSRLIPRHGPPTV